MKIAQVAPIYVPIPPKKYGGAEWIVRHLCDGMVDRGHEVTLFASGDSQTKAKLVSAVDKAPGMNKEIYLDLGYSMRHMFNYFAAAENQKKFDLIHWHVSKDIVPLMVSNFVQTPSVITFHNYHPQGKLDDLWNYNKKNQHKNVHYISISNRYTKNLPFDFYSTVYNGINVDDFTFNAKGGDYMFWMGRFLPIKGIDIAVNIAKKLNLPLKMGARELDTELDFYNKKVKPHISNKIQYIGELGLTEKNKAYGNAKVFINPILFDEPFGLVVPESMATGTPVIAFDKGAMSEIIKDGETGYLIKPGDIIGMTQAIKKIYDMPNSEYQKMRENCRKHVEQNFTVKRMLDGYEKVYKSILK